MLSLWNENGKNENVLVCHEFGRYEIYRRGQILQWANKIQYRILKESTQEFLDHRSVNVLFLLAASLQKTPRRQIQKQPKEKSYKQFQNEDRWKIMLMDLVILKDF